MYLIQNSQAVKKDCGSQKGYGRVRNLKNQLLQIDPPTVVRCSLYYPIARSIRGTIVVFTEISISVFREMQNLFLKFRAPHKGLDKTCY